MLQGVKEQIVTDDSWNAKLWGMKNTDKKIHIRGETSTENISLVILDPQFFNILFGLISWII